MTDSPAILLTGATGLVGRFVLRRLLQSGLDVAAIVRSGIGRSASEPPEQFARRRLEQVLQPFETDAWLPRPRAIAWDLAVADERQSPAQALNALDWDWLSARELIVVHCAASIRFQLDEASGEPFRTNVTGTKNLLRLCEQLKVREFHHVSTAYVGGHRSGQTVLERPVAESDVGGNDYESSKIQAELSVMRSGTVGRVTIHRPSIVIGDSQSAYTSTFHGFYAPLQIGCQYARVFGFSEQAGLWFRQRLGLGPNDSKNLVTVDWVAEGIAQTVLQGATSQGRQVADNPLVIHWTNPKAVACHEMQSAIVDSIERASPRATSASEPAPNPDDFREQMGVYESYFQSDPQFDDQNRCRVADHLVCPQVDYSLLSRLSDWAIAANFGWPKPVMPELPNLAITQVLQRIVWSSTQPMDTIVRLHLLGRGALEPVTIAIREDGTIYKPQNCCGWHQVWWVPLQVVTNCVSGSTSISDSIKQGYWLIEGKSTGEQLASIQFLINHIRLLLN